MGKSGQATEYTLEQLKNLTAGGDDLGEGRKVVASAGTAEALGTSTEIKEVILTAEISNTNIVCVGGSGVIAAEATREGTPLYPGDSMTINTSNLANVYIDSMVDGEGVTYTTQV